MTKNKNTLNDSSSIERSFKDNKANNNALVRAKNLSLAACLVLIIVVGIVNALLPAFKEIFNDLGQDLPLVSLLVMNSFNFWWVLPAIVLVFFIAMQTPQLSQNQRLVSLTKGAAIAGFVMAVLVLFITFLAIYLPVYPS